MTLVVAHRGASATRPENTIAAFRHAAALGADWVELDVHPTADGALAVHHDHDLADGRPVAAVEAADLPAAVPSLAAALDACAGMGVNVEVKSDQEHPAQPPFLVAVVAACRDWGGEVLLSSFDPGALDALRHLAPDLATGQLTLAPDRPAADTVAWIQGRGHRAWHPWWPVLDEAAVAAAHATGLVVNPWTVDEPDRIVELAGWGVDGIVTNDVTTCRRALGLE
ncbi:MAG: glycerophosphodiester phosphodiesterase [Acidimicrobiia bacterium]|nr:glycerophosphodiester phosphodiesterase [Acidimicrobiia bacterium]